MAILPVESVSSGTVGRVGLKLIVSSSTSSCLNTGFASRERLALVKAQKKIEAAEMGIA